MTGRFCGACGAPAGPDTAFCGSCGSPVAPAEGAPAPAAPYAQPQGPAHPQQHGAPYGQAQAGVPYGAPTQGGAPWGSAAPRAGGPAGRGAIDALLGGDWRGAAKAAGSSVLAMLGLALVGVLLLAAGDLGFREVLALTAGAVCTAVGGDVFMETSSDIFGSGDEFFDSGSEDFFGGGVVVSGSAGVGLLPLTLTLVGLTLLAWLFIRSLRARGVHRGRDVLLQGARTALVFTVLFLPLALVTRYRIDESDEVLGTVGRVGVSVWSTLTGALLFAVATLGLVWLFSRQTRGGLPGRLAAVRGQAVAPLLGALAVFSAGLLGVVAFLVYCLVQFDERVTQLGVFVLGAGNGMLASVLWSAGVPLDTDAGVAGVGLGDVAGGPAAEGVDLFTFTDESAWVWLAPVVLLLVLLAVATVLTVRQNSVEDARREGFRFAGALAVVAFAAALLLRVATEVSGGVAVFGGSADASATFNPFIAAVALGLWGLVAGLLGPVLATRIPSTLVTRLRGRFGVAAPRPLAPPPAAEQGWQQQPTQQFAQPPHAQQQPYGQPSYGPPPSYGLPPSYEPPPYPQQPLPPVPPPSQ
ncbi:streptophobe family protein [Blastococcus goldschmidtiae]|uniref:Streptophobe family protein n=1 Tax=Blastococcus goldschmidtiae TaxID=3075546 RepID=A0ABU2K3W4_9ACTN|nr:streptophobe family protein [Blastococcus sp. DSM 46792]MDT0274874.1 streptophobe family protein [Blastococcus sp. DSM 46792]